MNPVLWTSYKGTEHTQQDADSFLILPGEWPVLPAGPDLQLGSVPALISAQHQTTPTEVLDYRSRFMEALGYLSDWISTLELDRHNPTNRQAVADAALAYYEEQYVVMTLMHSTYFTELWDYGFGQTSLRIGLFFELCRLRVARREHFGPRWDQDERPQDWPHLREARITLPKSKPIGLFTMQEMEQAFVRLFRYWHSMPYHPELDAFVDRLLDKQATFVVASGSKKELDVPLYRSPLRSGADEQNPLSDSQFGPTLTAIFKFQLRYFNVTKRLQLVRGRKRVPFAALKLPAQLPYPFHIFTADWLRTLTEHKAQNIRAEMHERVREIMMQDLLHPGDREWLSFLRPVAQVTTQMMIDLFHDQEAARYDTEGKIKAHEALALKHASLRTGSRSRVVLDLLDKMLPYDACFMRDYVIEWPDLLARWDDLVHSDQPLLVQFMGHFELFWLGRIYTLYPSAAGTAGMNTVSGMYAHQTIYDTVHMWLRIVAYTPAYALTWEEQIAPALEEWVQTFFFVSLRRNGVPDDDAAARSRTMLRAYRERRMLTAGLQEQLARDAEIREVERMLAGVQVGGDGGAREGEMSEAMEVSDDESSVSQTSGHRTGRAGNLLTDPQRVVTRPLLQADDVADIEMPRITFYK